MISNVFEGKGGTREGCRNANCSKQGDNGAAAAARDSRPPGEAIGGRGAEAAAGSCRNSTRHQVETPLFSALGKCQ